MKRMTIFFSVLLTLLSYSLMNAQCTLACYSDIQLSLDASGNATITPEHVLASYGPACGTLIVEPSSFDCSDIGAPIEFIVTDPLTGNMCSGNIHVRYLVGTMSCYGNVNVQLEPSGNLTLTPDMILSDPPGACIPGAIINPTSVSCADIGSPVVVSITDPVSGNSCWSNVTVSYDVGAMSCYGNVNVQLEPSGSLTLTPDMILSDPPGACIPGAIINPPSVSCADIGSPVVVSITDPVSGNSCWSNVSVSYNVGAMSCYADVNVQLGPSGSLTLTPGILLFDPPGACIPGAIINPATVSCSDIGTPVVVTITDPVAGNSCWSTIVVDDPRPTSCEIIVPGTILCGDSGVPFSVNVTGGYGPFEYAWEIIGNPRGWSILTGQGTDNITMSVGDRKIKLEVTITDICGKKRKCSVKPECEELPAPFASDPISFGTGKQDKDNHDFELFPNPANHSLWVKFPEGTSPETGHMYIVDQHGRQQVSARYEQSHKGKMSIDIQDLQPGIYWLIMADVDHGSRIKKFVKL